MLEITYQEALNDNGRFNLLKFQDTAQHLGWKHASAIKLTFACYLAHILDIRVEWDPFIPELISFAPNIQLALLACQAKLPISIQMEGTMVKAT